MDKSTQVTERLKSIRVGEGVWARLKQRALDERVTVREVVERAAHRYLASGPSREPVTYPGPSMRDAHWTKDDDPA